jgi:hypothetical protein
MSADIRHQPTRSPSYNGFNFIILMGIGVIPSYINGFIGMFLQKGFQEFGDFFTPLVSAYENDGFSGMVVDSPDAIVLLGLAWSWDHDLLSFWAPHRNQGWQPGQVEFISVIKHFLRFQVVSDVFDRLFLTLYSGSGLLMVCCGRLKTIPPALSTRRTVSVETRNPVSSAMKSARRASVQSE